jgi:hypothetical protein
VCISFLAFTPPTPLSSTVFDPPQDSDEDDTDPHIRAKVYIGYALPEESSGIGTAHAEQTTAWPKHGYASRSQVHRAAWRLTPGFPSAPFVLPGEQAGLPVSHPRVALVQALTTHIEQLCALPDDLRQTTIDRYIRLSNRCGCHNERELAKHLQSQGQLLQCPIARLLKACGQLGVQVRLPACLTLGKRVQELSWHGLLGGTSAAGLWPLAQQISCELILQLWRPRGPTYAAGCCVAAWVPRAC